MGQKSTKPSPTLTVEDSKELDKLVTVAYKLYIADILGEQGGFECSETIDLVYLAHAKGDAIVKYVEKDASIRPIPVEVTVTTVQEFAKFVELSYDIFGVKTISITEYPPTLRLQKPGAVEAVANTIAQCEHRYVVVGVGLTEIGRDERAGHQNILIFDKERKKCIVIEPKTRIQWVTNLYKRFLKRLRLTDYELVEAPDQCIQAVADDDNCMYWSLLLLTRYLQGSYESVKAASDSIMKEYPNKEALRGYVNAFKHGLYQKGIPLPPVPKGGKQWETSSTANRKRRPRNRPRHLRKTNSRSSKSARHTRRRG